MAGDGRIFCQLTTYFGNETLEFFFLGAGYEHTFQLLCLQIRVIFWRIYPSLTVDEMSITYFCLLEVLGNLFCKAENHRYRRRR